MEIQKNLWQRNIYIAMFLIFSICGLWSPHLLGEDNEILGQIFSNSFKKQDFQPILERYYLRFIICPCLKPLLKPLVFHSLLCLNRVLGYSQVYTEKIKKDCMLKTG